MSKLNKLFQYNGNDITFRLANGEVMVNATQMAKSFGKKTRNWLDLDSTKKFLECLNDFYLAKNSHLLSQQSDNESRVRISDTSNLIITKPFSPKNGGGTWFHEDVALEFSRWLNPEFAIWCNYKIKEMVNKGYVTVDGDDLIDKITSLLNDSKKEMDELRKEVLYLKKTLPENTPSLQKDFMTVREYCIKHRKYAPKEIAVEYGKRCSALCNVNGITIKKVDDDKWGKINTYPLDILETVIK